MHGCKQVLSRWQLHESSNVKVKLYNIYTYIHTYVRTYVRTYVHTYIHTYIHRIYIYIYLSRAATRLSRNEGIKTALQRSTMCFWLFLCIPMYTVYFCLHCKTILCGEGDGDSPRRVSPITLLSLTGATPSLLWTSDPEKRSVGNPSLTWSGLQTSCQNRGICGVVSDSM